MEATGGTIYKIFCKSNLCKSVYIGSSKNFITRIDRHRTNTHNQNSRKYNYKLYKTIRDNGDWDNWSIEPLETFEMIDDIELLKKENDYIDFYKDNLNCKRAYLSPEDKKKYKHIYNKQYYLKNKPKKILNKMND